MASKKFGWRIFFYLLGICVIFAVALSGYFSLQNSLRLHFSESTPTQIDIRLVDISSTEDVNSMIATSSPTLRLKTRYVTKTTPLKTQDKKYFVYRGPLPPDVTVVTAYFNLGSFKKGWSSVFDTKLYVKWATVYQFIRNPLVVYTDSIQFATTFKQLRIGYENITKILVVDRKSVWAFDNVDRIRKIYSDPNYPKHHPNTVVPGYSCAQHAKYAVVEESIEKNYFNTTYFTWIDLGYFRNVLSREKEFVIQKPPNFNESRVAMNRVYNVKMNTPVRDIFRSNRVWIGGGMFFGNKETLPTFIADYRLAVERYLNMNLSSTDQQVIYSMNTDSEQKQVPIRVPLQPYFYGGAWFGLGFDCYRELVP